LGDFNLETKNIKENFDDNSKELQS